MLVAFDEVFYVFFFENRQKNVAYSVDSCHGLAVKLINFDYLRVMVVTSAMFSYRIIEASRMTTDQTTNRS
jgi:hypothetical protein